MAQTAWSIFQQGGGDSVAVAWAKQLLQMINAPQSDGNIQFIYDWEKSEGGGGKYNPLNQGPVPGQPSLTTTGSQFGGGAADYASWQAGLQGASDYLNMSNYRSVLSALRSDNPTAARNALWSSPWAASHYGYGSDWYSGAIPGGTNVIDSSYFSGNTDSTASVEDTGYSTANCLIGFHSSIATTCVFSKTQARALIGGMLLGTAGLTTLLGSLVLVAFALNRSGALGAASKGLALVPGASGLASKVGNAL
jgi:hypothetical protein